MSPEEQGFLNYIAKQPWDEPHCHNIYADWLEEQGRVEEAVWQRNHVPAEEWIRDFAGRLGLNYEELMDGTVQWIESGEYLSRGSLLESEWVPDEFWEHYECVVGRKVVEDKKSSFFSCSC